MATIPSSSRPVLLSLSLFLLVLLNILPISSSFSSPTPTILSSHSTVPDQLGGGGGKGGRLGGRNEIKDVENNKEVQDLGRFAVQAYDRSPAHPAKLSFSRVVAAESQVVAGTKYFLKIAVKDDKGGKERAFDAVVLVTPWLKPTRELVSFTPSSPN